MLDYSRRSRALAYGISAIAASIACTSHANAQTQTLDAITVVATKTQERAIDALAPVTVLDQKAIQAIDPSRINQLLYNIPGVSFQDRGDSPETSINIRGLQDFGRVAVIVDGARQNYQRTGHNANGTFYLEPELLAGLDIVRGPTANIYGSGAIGGVASFRTKDVDDILKPGEKAGTNTAVGFGTNTARLMTSGFSAWRFNPNVEAMAGGVYRTQDDYYTGSAGQGVPTVAAGLVENSRAQVSSGIAKVNLRPMDGHEIKLGGIFQNDIYDIGQPARAGTGNGGTSIYATDAKNHQANARWLYSKPEDRLLDWDANVYWNRTENNQVKLRNSTTSQGNAITGFNGFPRGYTIDTVGTDIHNTSRADFGAWRTALTLGVDGFQDSVSTFDQTGNSNVTTPGGKRTVSGAFTQLKMNYMTWLEIVSALRFDNYSLDGSSTGTSGNRFSPKITVGVTPVPGFQPYVSYAEGYRAPALTETLVTGAHVATSPGAGLFNCPSGTFQVGADNFFCFLSNPNLKPEVGKNKEVGLNLKYDNIFQTNDSFRGKFNGYRNDLEDYIDLTAFGPTAIFGGTVFYPFYQYQNVPKAHIQGFEAETMYDAGIWFAGVSGQITRGYNDVTGVGLASIPGDKITTTGGIRSSDRKATVGVTLIAVKANENIPTNYRPSTAYELVNMFFNYQVSDDVGLQLGVDNLLNRYYRPFAVPSTDPTSTQNDVFWTAPPPGLVVKGALRVHFAHMK